MYREKMSILLSTIIYPFASYESYKSNPMKHLVKKNLFKEYKNSYDKVVKEDLYKYLLRKFSLSTLDYVDLIFYKYYGHASIQGKYCEDIYLDIISSFANSFICHRNGRLALKYWESEKDEKFIGPYKGINKIALWNTINRLMCTDIIVISYLIDNNFSEIRHLSGYYSSIMLEDLQLEKILSKGVAETHIHKGAAINFSISWIHLMNLSLATLEDYKSKLLTNCFYEYNDIVNVVYMIAIVRLLMIGFLGINKKFKIMFKDYYSGDKRKEDITKEDQRVLNIISAVLEGKNKVDKIDENYNFMNVWEYLKEKFELDISNMNEDYVSQLLGSKRIDTSGENIFLFEALKYMKSNSRDEVFKCLFFKYINIKNVVFQAKVQADSVKGLKNFQNNYKRSTTLNGYTSKEYWLILMKTQLQNKHLKKLEFRFAFQDTKKELVNGIKSFLRAYQELLECYDASEEAPQIALIFHMIKRLDEEWYDKCWQNTFNLADDDDKARELFYNKNQRFYLKQIEIFKELRNQVQGLDEILIGIDAASIEDNTEPWVFAPVYNKARGREDCDIRYKEECKPIKTLGFTFHVGEDFRHILTGLRHVDEVIQHFSYHSGDRIGHGIVLGLDIDYWCKNNQVVMIPRGEYLDNLLWLWGMNKDYSGLEGLDISYLERQIMKLAEEVYVNIDGVTIYILWKVYQEKFKEFTPDERFRYEHELIDKKEHNENDVFCKYLPKKYVRFGERWSYETLLYVQHCRCYSERLLQPIQIEVHYSSVKLYESLQKIILQNLNDKGIIIESNPTSNLVIGQMKDLFSHYIFNLNDVDFHNKEKRTMFSINSDDPSVFNTNVSNEFAYVYYALQKNGYSREEILIWIDRIRGYGMDSSFITNSQTNVITLKNKIQKILNQLE